MFEGELAGIARHIIPVALVDWPTKVGRPSVPVTESRLSDAGLDRGDQRIVDQKALVVANLGAAAGERGRAEGERRQDAGSETETHGCETPDRRAGRRA